MSIIVKFRDNIPDICSNDVFHIAIQSNLNWLLDFESNTVGNGIQQKAPGSLQLLAQLM